MIDAKDKYRFVTQERLRKINVEGFILPLRNQKRIFRGEDEAHLEEAYYEYQLPSRKSDFVSSYQGHGDFGDSIQLICGNGIWDSIIEYLLRRRNSDWGTSDKTVFANGATFISVRDATAPVGNGDYLYPWKKDALMEGREEGGYDETDDARSWREFYLEQDASDARNEAIDEADNTRDDETDAAREKYNTDYTEQNARYVALSSAWHERYYTTDKAEVKALEDKRDADNKAAQEERDRRIKNIQDDDEGDKTGRIKKATDDCSKIVANNNYSCALASHEISKATDEWYAKESAKIDADRAKTLDDYDKEREAANYKFDKKKIAAYKTYYDTIKEACAWRAKVNGEPHYYGVEFDLANLAKRSLVLDDWRCHNLLRCILPYQWERAERLFADRDLMYFQSLLDKRFLRFPYRVSYQMQVDEWSGDKYTYTVPAAYHPELGTLGNSSAFADHYNNPWRYSGMTLSYGRYDSDDEVQPNHTNVEGGTKFYLRLGNRYTLGKIKSVKALVYIAEDETKTEYDDPAEQTGRHNFSGNKYKWVVVSLEKKGVACQNECERIDKVRDDYFDADRELTRQYHDDIKRIEKDCAEDVARITSSYQAQIEALEDERDEYIAQRTKQLKEAIRAKSKEANIAIDATSDEDERRQIRVNATTAINSLTNEANADISNKRGTISTSINNLERQRNSEIESREDEQDEDLSDLFDDWLQESSDLSNYYNARERAIIQAKNDEISALKKEYTDAWEKADDDFSQEYDDAYEEYSDAIDEASEIEDREQRQAAYKAAGEALAQARHTARAKLYQTQTELAADYIKEKIYSIDTEAREIWQCDIAPIARQMGGGYEWYCHSRVVHAVQVVVEYDFPTLSGANTCTNGQISSQYWNEVKEKVEEEWAKFLPAQEEEEEESEA